MVVESSCSKGDNLTKLVFGRTQFRIHYFITGNWCGDSTIILNVYNVHVSKNNQRDLASDCKMIWGHFKSSTQHTWSHTYLLTYFFTALICGFLFFISQTYKTKKMRKGIMCMHVCMCIWRKTKMYYIYSTYNECTCMSPHGTGLNIF
jgi:hypothetical protein